MTWVIIIYHQKTNQIFATQTKCHNLACNHKTSSCNMIAVAACSWCKFCQPTVFVMFRAVPGKAVLVWVWAWYVKLASTLIYNATCLF